MEVHKAVAFTDNMPDGGVECYELTSSLNSQGRATCRIIVMNIHSTSLTIKTRCSNTQQQYANKHKNANCTYANAVVRK
ncbi:hypothetical protein Mapa_007073 [Marchantia paleacea]|nr:hypothetical protein Mapa_007073 [Marchantia paleacea]